MIELTDDNYDEVVASHEGDVFIDFYATWCRPCKVMTPIVEELVEEYPNTLFAKVNVEDNEELVTAFQVASMPTFVAFNPKNEEPQEASRLVGATSKGILESTLLVK